MPGGGGATDLEKKKTSSSDLPVCGQVLGDSVLGDSVTRCPACSRTTRAPGLPIWKKKKMASSSDLPVCGEEKIYTYDARPPRSLRTQNKFLREKRPRPPKFRVLVTRFPVTRATVTPYTVTRYTVTRYTDSFPRDSFPRKKTNSSSEIQGTGDSVPRDSGYRDSVYRDSVHRHGIP